MTHPDPDLAALRAALKAKETQLRAVEAALARELERGIALRLELASARLVSRRLRAETTEEDTDDATIPATRTQTDPTVPEGTPAHTPRGRRRGPDHL